MRCEKVRESVWETGREQPSADVRQHIESCAACRSYVSDFSILGAGLHALRSEAVPEASWGFRDRVLRRLGEQKTPGSAAPEFLDSAGRRVILATLVLVFTMLLAMILPSSGPVRRESSVDTYYSQAETATAVSYPVDWTNIPSVPILVQTEPVVFRGDR